MNDNPSITNELIQSKFEEFIVEECTVSSDKQINGEIEWSLITIMRQHKYVCLPNSNMDIIGFVNSTFNQYNFTDFSNDFSKYLLKEKQEQLI
eukprot:400645_1